MKSGSLLLVDADPAVHELLKGWLGRADRRIESAFAAEDGLDRLRRTPFDVVVAGEGTNGSDGLSLVKKVRAIRPAARVIVTGAQDPARVVRAIRERAFSYVHKPLGRGAMVDVVDQAIETPGWKDDIRVVSALPAWITLDVRCKLDAAERTAQFLKEMLADVGGPAADDILAAFRELLMNAIEHGGKSNPRKRSRVSLLRTARALIVHIHDPGPGFSLDLLPHAAISNPAGDPTRHVEVRAGEGRRPGGFGILMTRNLVDELLYNQRGNAVLFVKYL